MGEDPRERGKRLSAERALRFVEDGMVVGVGTGSTVAYFIEALAERRHDIEGAVASSRDTEEKLKARGIRLIDLNAAGDIPLYVDGADECDPWGRLIKGGGGALTREKIIAEAAARFVCILDASKRVELLGRFPLPVEVIPMARSLVGRKLRAIGGLPVWREGFITDNGHWILDVHGLSILDPVALEGEINQIPGVVTVGLFARRPADLVIVDGEPVRPKG